MKNQLDTPFSTDPAAELVAMLAHDLRGSVTTIKGFSQLALRQCPPPPPLSAYLQAVVNESNRVAALIDDLVLLSQFESEPQLFRIGPADVREVLALAVQQSHELYAARQVVVEPIQTALPIWCDVQVTGRALMRLISTLLRYCSEKQPVTISATLGLDGPLVGLSSMSDITSSRFPALKRALGTTGSSKDEGLSASGLGLYLGRRLIELQGGRVWIEQSLEVGVRFVVMLPQQR